MGLGIGKRNPFGSRWRWNIRSANKDVSPRKRNTQKNKHYPGRWKAVMANQGGQEKGGVGGRQGAWVPVNWDWKGHL